MKGAKIDGLESELSDALREIYECPHSKKVQTQTDDETKALMADYEKRFSKKYRRTFSFFGPAKTNRYMKAELQYYLALGEPIPDEKYEEGVLI